VNATLLPDTALDPQVARRVLALADDELVLGHRHSEWLGLSPFLEEDLTMASIAQDELGHARALYALAWPDLADRDSLVMRRPASSYRSCNLVERVGFPWELALVRHWFYDAAEEFRWAALEALDVPGLSGVVAAVHAEERFHRRHGEDLVTRLSTGSPEGRARVQYGIDVLWPDALAMLHDERHVVTPFCERVRSLAGTVGLQIPPVEVVPTDRHERHRDFAEVHRSFVEVFEIDPLATW
jgi:ring-1,2-phenylacetyl-CoA epoxidase subunit PaaC